MQRTAMLTALGLVLTCSAIAAPSAGQVPAAASALRPTLTPADYGRWETIRQIELSPDGAWVAAEVVRVDGEAELRVRDLRGERDRVIPRASRPLFSPDGKWLAYTLEPESALPEPMPTVMAVALYGGTPIVVGGVVDYRFSSDGHYLMLRGFTTDAGGAPVTLRPLAGGAVRTLEFVEMQAWSDRGALLAFVEVRDTLRTLRLFDGSDGSVRGLDAGAPGYTGLSWHDGRLAVFRSSAGGAHEVLVWNDLAAAPSGVTAVPPDHRLDGEDAAGGRAFALQDSRPLRWSTDGRTLYVGVHDDAASDTATGASPSGATRDSANVQVWHSADVSIVPERRTRALIDRNRGSPAAWHLETGDLVILADSVIDEITLSRGRYALGLDVSRYERERMFGPEYRDLYVIDTRTGERTRVAERVQHDVVISETGRYVVWVEGGHYRAWDAETRTHADLTVNLPTDFINNAHDFTAPDKPPFGTAGWTPGDSLLLIHDRYDIWAVRPDGSGGERLTRGAEERVRHRRIWLDPDQRVVDLRAGAYALLYGEQTKHSGFARVRLGAPAERLLWVDASVSRLTKAADADVLMYRMERFDMSPDYFVTDTAFSSPVRATDTNPFLREYAWGRAELVDYADADGRMLQGALFYPANHDPTKRYPLIVYPYEMVSNTLHTFTLPSEQVPYNPTVWTQQGYFVLRPDVMFTARQPGVSSLATLHAALDAVLALGVVDSTRVGIIGHSWGGYQAAFAASRSARFAAAVAGAPISNMISMYGSIYWSTGGTDARMFELEQGRMEVPFWEDLPAYIENSPLFSVPEMQVPLLVAFGDRDGSVDWHQGIELYNAARRAGKQLVMLVYPGENHTLAQRGNVADYHYRILEWFAHYLKGEPPASWIVQGDP